MKAWSIASSSEIDMDPGELDACRVRSGGPPPLEPEVAQEAGLEGREVDESGKRHVVRITPDADVAALRHLSLEALAKLDGVVLAGGPHQEVAEVALHREALQAELFREVVRVANLR